MLLQSRLKWCLDSTWIKSFQIILPGYFQYLSFTEIKITRLVYTSINHDMPYISNCFFTQCNCRSKTVMIYKIMRSDSPTIILRGETYIIYKRYVLFWLDANYHGSLIPPLFPRTVFSNLAFWCHHSWPVMPWKREALVLWHHIRRLFLHAQIGANVILTRIKSESQWMYLYINSVERFLGLYSVYPTYLKYSAPGLVPIPISLPITRILQFVLHVTIISNYL